MSERVRSQNLSIMMTDIQGYSTTSALSTRQETIDLIRRHNQLMIPVIEFYGGKIIKTIGDAFLCTFLSSTDAVICAIIIQLLLREYNQRLKNESQRLNLRVVIHSGDVTLEGNDIFGTAVNVTARIEGLPCFPGGSIGISETTYLLMDKGEIVAEKIGPQQLKGIPEPVTVYCVPLEKQKLTSLPVNLLQLVEQVVSPDAGSGASISEWQNSIKRYLQEKNWGQNIGENLNKATQQIGQNLGQARTKLVKTFGQKTVLEKGAAACSQATLTTRMKCFLIDMIILGILYVVLNIAWWPAHRMLYGSPFSAERQDGYESVYQNGTNVYIRPIGIVEGFLDFNVKYPVVLFWIYFGFFWKLKGASPGQIAGKSAVVMANGDPIPLTKALVRSALFLPSTMLFGIGVLPIFVGDRQTLYDKITGTIVVE